MIEILTTDFSTKDVIGPTSYDAEFTVLSCVVKETGLYMVAFSAYCLNGSTYGTGGLPQLFIRFTTRGAADSLESGVDETGLTTTVVIKPLIVPADAGSTINVNYYCPSNSDATVLGNLSMSAAIVRLL